MTGPEPVGGLTLRPWMEQDAPALIAAAGDPLLQRFTTIRVAGTEEALRWLAVQDDSRRAGVRYSFAVLGAAGDLVGSVVLRDPAGEAEVGYWTVAAARGRGVASRALGSLTRWAFVTFPAITRVRLLHQVDNPGSCRVAVKSGYAYERTLPPFGPYPQEGHLHLRVR